MSPLHFHGITSDFVQFHYEFICNIQYSFSSLKRQLIDPIPNIENFLTNSENHINMLHKYIIHSNKHISEEVGLRVQITNTFSQWSKNFVEILHFILSSDNNIPEKKLKAFKKKFLENFKESQSLLNEQAIKFSFDNSNIHLFRKHYLKKILNSLAHMKKEFVTFDKNLIVSCQEFEKNMFKLYEFLNQQ